MIGINRGKSTAKKLAAVIYIMAYNNYKKILILLTEVKLLI